MRNYINPSVYAYTDSEWREFEFVDRMLGLVEFLDRCLDVEKPHDKQYDLIRFRASDDLLAEIHLMNPFITDGAAAPHYQQQYRSAILPGLMRRLRYCPDDGCQGYAINSRAGVVVEFPPPTRLSNTFIAECALCSICAHPDPTCLITHEDADAFQSQGSFFDHVVDVSTEALGLIDPLGAFPWQADENEEALFGLAIRANYERLKIIDPTWAQQAPLNVVIAPSFWRTLRSSNFGDLELHYKRRIIYSLTQILYARSIDINDHRMGGQVVSYENSNLRKWNAYVFQMGAGPQDRRCSRIYYAKRQGVIILSEYEPDAH